MDFEIVNTGWLNADKLMATDYKVGRISFGNGRSYIKIIDGGLEQPFKLYTSLTTAINSCAPMEQPLLEWYCKLGYTEAKRQLYLSQHYGTLMHLLIGDYLTNGFFDFDKVEDHTKNYVSEKFIKDKEADQWADKLKHDILAFVYFSHEYKIIPYAIEHVMVSEKGFGTLIDLVCQMTISEKAYWGEVYKTGDRKGQPKETKKEIVKTVIINFKSGRHAFYKSNGIQCLCEKDLFEENFPDIKIDAAYNWSPKEWTDTPTYNLKEWTGEEISKEEINHVLGIAQIRFGEKALNKKYKSIQGIATNTVLPEQCLVVKTPKEYAESKYSFTN